MLRVLGIWKNCTSKNECVYHQLEQGLLKLWMVKLRKPRNCLKIEIFQIPFMKFIKMSNKMP